MAECRERLPGRMGEFTNCGVGDDPSDFDDEVGVGIGVEVRD